MDEAARFAAMMHRSAALKQRIATELADTVIAVVDACETSLRAGGKLMFCGNGGSAADSQHLATELLIRLRGAVERDSWPALALTLDPAMLTAAGNDYGYERVFERPLRGLGRRGDVLFGITTSGRSPNVVRALAAAREMGAISAGYTLLRLPYEIKDLFVEWLDEHAPLKSRHVLSLIQGARGGRLNDPRWGSRMKGEGAYAELLRTRFRLACARLGFNKHDWRPDASQFRAPPQPGDQLKLL